MVAMVHRMKPKANWSTCPNLCPCNSSTYATYILQTAPLPLLYLHRLGTDPLKAVTKASERDGSHRRSSSLPAAPPSSNRDSLRHTNSSGRLKPEAGRVTQKRPSIISASLAKLQGLKIMQNKDGGEKASNVELEAMAM